MATRTLLVVDDHLPLRELMARKLELDGFHVLRAANGMEGLTALRENPVDLVIVDLMMPVMDGFEFLRRLRTEPRPVPTIVLSAAGTRQRRDELLEAGAVAVLAKPITAQTIRAAIDQVFRAAGGPHGDPDTTPQKKA